jgi:hypothetical protein
LASDFSLTFDGSHLPQSGASLGIHVDPFVRHLSQPEVADMVEGAITNRSSSVALSILIFWLGREWMQKLFWTRDNV